MQEGKQAYRVFKNTYEYAIVELDKTVKNPEQHVQGLILSGKLKFKDSENSLTVIPEHRYELGILNDR